MQKFELEEFRELSSKSMVVDLRKPEIFADGFIEKSVSIPYGQNFIGNLSELTSEETNILLVGESEDMPEAVEAVRLSGLSNVLGFLNGGFETWKEVGAKFDMLICIDPDEFAMDYQFDEFYLVDVRDK